MDRERKILENLNVSSDVSSDFKNAFLLFSQESNGNSMRMIERDNSELLVEWKNYLYRNRGKIYSRVKSVYIVI